jgi:hypothetical protein
VNKNWIELFIFYIYYQNFGTLKIRPKLNSAVKKEAAMAKLHEAKPGVLDPSGFDTEPDVLEEGVA